MGNDSHSSAQVKENIHPNAFDNLINRELPNLFRFISENLTWLDEELTDDDVENDENYGIILYNNVVHSVDQVFVENVLYLSLVNCILDLSCSKMLFSSKLWYFLNQLLL